MPELPEVETIFCGLKEKILNWKITDIIVKEKKLIAYPEKSDFIEGIKNNKIKDIYRRGKYIIFNLKNKKDLIIHLRMTGKLLLKETNQSIDKHTHIIFKLAKNNCKQELRFNNMRKFGRTYLVDETQWRPAGNLNNLGPEPLADDFKPENFRDKFKNRSAKIKSLLLKQGFIAGVGNIYADEALFEAGINPKRKANTLTEEEIEKLYYTIKSVLKKGIKYCGTSVQNYVNEKGETGSFQEKLKVYNQEGEKCQNCDSQIKKMKVGGRGTHYCPQCQQ